MRLLATPSGSCRNASSGFGLTLFTSANLDPNSFKDLLIDADEGVYFGFAKINNDPIEEMVMSIGWNPQYGNKEKSVVSNHKYKIIIRD
jgi:FAD synthase